MGVAATADHRRVRNTRYTNEHCRVPEPENIYNLGGSSCVLVNS